MPEEQSYEELTLSNGIRSMMSVLGLVFICVYIASLIMLITFPEFAFSVLPVITIGSVMIPSLSIALICFKRLDYVWTSDGLKKRPD